MQQFPQQGVRKQLGKYIKKKEIWAGGLATQVPAWQGHEFNPYF